MKRTPLARAPQRKLPLLVLILCLIQPGMDVLSFWADRTGLDNAVTLLLRLAVLLVTVVTGFLLSRRRWVYLAAGGVLLLLTAGHVAGCLYYGYQDPAADLTNLVRIYQLPLTTLAFITFLRRDGHCMDALKRGILGAFGLTVLVKLLAALTGTDPHTYANKGIGLLGWFLTPSAQSAILSMMVPIAILCVLERTRLDLRFAAGIGIVGLGTLYLFATRLSYAALLGCAFGLALSCLLFRLLRRERTLRVAAVFAVLGLAAVLLIGCSPMQANNEKVAENARIKQEDILALTQADRAAAQAEGLTGQALEAASLKSAYEKYLPGLTERFGLERAAEHYDYTTDVAKLSNTRLLRQSYCLLLQQEQPLTRLFGVELGDLVYQGETYDAENDFHGIYFLCGGAGLALMLAFLAYFLLRAAGALLRDFRRYFTLPVACFGIALICGLAHAYFTAGVLRRPNSGFYLAVILAAVDTLTQKRTDCKEEKRFMTLINGLRPRLRAKLPLIVFILFVIQPVMDVLSFWVTKWGMSNTPTLLLRLVVLAAILATGLLLTRRRRVYGIVIAVCAVIGAGHIFACAQAGYQNIVSDLSNYIRVIQLPLTTVCFITCLRENESCYEAVKKGLAVSLSIILAVQVLAVVTGTEPHTYSDGRGLIGWFSNTNTQSSIIAMLAPVTVAWLCQRRGLKSVWLWISLIGSGFSMYFLGTRLAYLGIIATCFGLGISTLIVRLKDWRRACALMLTGVAFLALLPLSPMMGHRGSWGDEMGDKQGWADNMIQEPGEIQEPEEPDTSVPLYDPELVAALTEEQRLLIAEIAPVYEHFVSDFVAIFGVERTAVLFDFSTDITELTASRPKKLMVAQALMDDSPFSARLFGVELSRFTMKGHNYDVENDFHGIYYLYGAVGLAAMVLFLGYFVVLILRALLKNFRRYFTLDAAGWGIALVMCLLHCGFTASTLRRPSSSIYLAAVLTAAYYLVKLRTYPDKIEG